MPRQYQIPSQGTQTTLRICGFRETVIWDWGLCTGTVTHFTGFGCLWVEKYNWDLHYENIMFVAKATGGHSEWRIEQIKSVWNLLWPKMNQNKTPFITVVSPLIRKTRGLLRWYPPLIQKTRGSLPPSIHNPACLIWINPR